MRDRQPPPRTASDRDVTPGACGDRQLLAGTERCLGGRIALLRTTFSAAAVKSSHFSPLLFKEVPIKSWCGTALRTHLLV